MNTAPLPENFTMTLDSDGNLIKMPKNGLRKKFPAEGYTPAAPTLALTPTFNPSPNPSPSPSPNPTPTPNPQPSPSPSTLTLTLPLTRLHACRALAPPAPHHRALRRGLTLTLTLTPNP